MLHCSASCLAPSQLLRQPAVAIPTITCIVHASIQPFYPTRRATFGSESLLSPISTAHTEERLGGESHIIFSQCRWRGASYITGLSLWLHLQSCMHACMHEASRAECQGETGDEAIAPTVPALAADAALTCFCCWCRFAAVALTIHCYLHISNHCMHIIINDVQLQWWNITWKLYAWIRNQRASLTHESLSARL